MPSAISEALGGCCSGAWARAGTNATAMIATASAARAKERSQFECLHLWVMNAVYSAESLAWKMAAEPRSDGNHVTARAATSKDQPRARAALESMWPGGPATTSTAPHQPVPADRGE